MDNQQREMEAALAEQQATYDLEIQRLQDDSLKISVPGEVSFDFGSSQLNPAFVPTIDSMADILRRYEKTVVHVVGHTDSVGSASFNLQLSERRADTVAAAFRQRGIEPERLRTEGRGMNEPRASNETDAGRQLNRRVEIVIRPIVEGQEERAVQPPPAT
jgi:outer membrane protein OmpA-like peptidoglycan-associated protein